MESGRCAQKDPSKQRLQDDLHPRTFLRTLMHSGYCGVGCVSTHILAASPIHCICLHAVCLTCVCHCRHQSDLGRLREGSACLNCFRYIRSSKQDPELAVPTLNPRSAHMRSIFCWLSILATPDMCPQDALIYIIDSLYACPIAWYMTF